MNCMSGNEPKVERTFEKGTRIVLVSMPWATTTRPSIALGILTNICNQEKIPVLSFYLNMDITAMVGFEVAKHLAEDRLLHGLSEHIFAADIFGIEALCSNEYLEKFAKINFPPPFNDQDYLRNLRDEVVKKFLDNALQRILLEDPTVVGFTATFNQVMASLALANRIKKVRPDIKIIVGGASFDGEMGQEYHRALHEILDHVFLGEADESFREYIIRLNNKQSTNKIPGVTYYENQEVKLVPGKPLDDMNKSPVPDYDDFFFEKDRLYRETGRVFNIEYINFESSRGCWWGQKSHCMFCGVNEDMIPYREKSVDRIISDIITLSHRYKIISLAASDWIISKKSRKEIFKRLKELDYDIEFFYETRSDLTKEEISLMKDAQVIKIQPGIESLSTEILRLMGKGTTRIRHIQFMRWCKEYGILIAYNMLAGFPGEKEEWYFEMAGFLPKVFHLQPPRTNLEPIEMHRFSPLFEHREKYQVASYQIREDYSLNFPLGMIDPLKIGYFFSYSSLALADQDHYLEPVREVIQHWKDSHDKGTFPLYYYSIGPGFTRIVDTRFGDGRYLYVERIYQDILLLCDKVQHISKLKEMLHPLYPNETTDGTFEKVVEEMVTDDLLMQEGQMLLTLPIGSRPRTTKELMAYVLGKEAVVDMDEA